MRLRGHSNPSVLFLLINAESGTRVCQVCPASLSSERKFSISESFTGEQTFLSLLVQI